MDLMVRDRLEFLAQANGGVLTPAAVVEDAVDEASPLHSYLTWDDSEAAHKQRLSEARRLIRSVRIIVHETHVTIRPVSWVRDPDLPSAQPGYVSTRSLVTDRDRARRAIEAELERVGLVLKRTRDLALTLDMEAEVDAFLEELGALRARVVAA